MRNYIIIALNSKELELFKQYITDCNYSGFRGHNNYSRINDVREFFYKWHFESIKQKIEKCNTKEKRYITLTLPELKTIRALFQRVDCCQPMIDLQERFRVN